MPEYRFIGDPRDRKSGPNTLDFRGHVFRRDGWTLVEDAELAAKLDGNSHFERRAAAEPVEVERRPVALSEDRDALVARAEALGIAVDGRWGLPRIQSEIAAAEARAAEG
ncbi:hypothetical protein [Methylocystis sp. S23]